MKSNWEQLNEQDRAAFQAVHAFLSVNGRLEDRATIDWALHLKPNDIIKRLALLQLIDNHPNGRNMKEPWGSAWRLIEESWSKPLIENPAGVGAYSAQHRLRAGDRSWPLIKTIVDLVAPRLKVDIFSRLHYQEPSKHKRPKKITDLFSISLSSGETFDPEILELGTLVDQSFLVSLAIALDAAVMDGLNIARRMGWEYECQLWRLGEIHRVYYVPVDERANDKHEPDEFHNGIAPSTKLLHAVVKRLADLDYVKANEFVTRWKITNSIVHLRLWAALSQDSRITPANEVCAMLLSLDDKRFWNLYDYPEIAELRAKRFGEFDIHGQSELTARIRKLPPRNYWPKKFNGDPLRKARIYWAIRELKRIQIAGAPLLRDDAIWLNKNIHDFPELAQMARLDEGFLDVPKATLYEMKADNRYDMLGGEERLRALETALSSTNDGWRDNISGSASAWIGQLVHSHHILNDLESIPDGGGPFPRVWQRFGWTYSSESKPDGPDRNLYMEATRVLSLLEKLPEATIRSAIDGITHWFSAWQNQIIGLPQGINVWLKLWPIAVEATNVKTPVEENVILNTVARSTDDEPRDLDTLNTPVGRLVGVFLAACPALKVGDLPFEDDNTHKRMRDAIESSIGPAGLIVKYRLIESLHYFLRADSEWTKNNLISSLLPDTSDARVLWRAVSHRTRFLDELKIIGLPMVDRAIDPRINRKIRQSLIFSLIIESLHALNQNRDPAVPFIRITQMIRSLDDEVRAYAAEAIQRFVRDLSTPNDKQTSQSAVHLFQTAAKPFLQKVWPQERSLTTPGVSKALADLPATAHQVFAEVVDTIERFLEPFESWSLLDYGLYGRDHDMEKISIIDNQEKAEALLQLFDRTISTSEGAVIPHDLANALDQIQKIAPRLVHNQVFRRLSTAVRRI